MGSILQAHLDNLEDIMTLHSIRQAHQCVHWMIVLGYLYREDSQAK